MFTSVYGTDVLDTSVLVSTIVSSVHNSNDIGEILLLSMMESVTSSLTSDYRIVKAIQLINICRKGI